MPRYRNNPEIDPNLRHPPDMAGPPPRTPPPQRQAPEQRDRVARDVGRIALRDTVQRPPDQER
jgi:hypothetical protein